MSSELGDEPNGRQEDPENQPVPKNGTHPNLPRSSEGGQFPGAQHNPGPSSESESESNIPENTNSNTGQHTSTLPRRNTMVSLHSFVRNAC